MAAKIIFITLSVANKLRVVCDLIEKEYLDGKQIIVNVADEEEGNSLDRMLWTWKQSSFIPHRFVQDLTSPVDETIIITNNLNNDLKFDTLILISPTDLEKISWFDTIIDFAEKYNPSKLESDRNRYKEYRDNKLALETYNPGEYLNKESEK